MGDSRMTLTQRHSENSYIVYLHLRQNLERITTNIFDLKMEIGISGVACGSISAIYFGRLNLVCSSFVGIRI